MKYYDINHLPQHGKFGAYHKRDSAEDTFPTLAAHVGGEFIIHTRNGEQACNDAYVLVDPEGYPYQINRKAFEDTYEKIPACCG
jgi:hypothetical protein